MHNILSRINKEKMIIYKHEWEIAMKIGANDILYQVSNITNKIRCTVEKDPSINITS